MQPRGSIRAPSAVVSAGYGAFRRGRTLVIALLYGEESEWLRNLRAGSGHVIRAGRTFVVGAAEVVATRDAGSLLARLSPPKRAYCRLAEKLAMLDLEEQLPGFGRRGRLSEPA